MIDTNTSTRGQSKLTKSSFTNFMYKRQKVTDSPKTEKHHKKIRVIKIYRNARETKFIKIHDKAWVFSIEPQNEHGNFPLNHKMSVFYICSVKKGQSHSIMHDANEV